jgi:predicted RNA-binding protein with PUA-like domain
MTKANKKFWLMKSEPDSYSIDDLAKDKVTPWDGVRNYQARNYMMKEMSVGDEVLFYHSNTKPPGVVGLATVTSGAQPDITAQDPESDYYDPKACVENPRWYCVNVGFKKKLPTPVSLQSIKDNPKLKKMLLVQKGQRLSIQPLTEIEYKTILKMAESAPG